MPIFVVDDDRFLWGVHLAAGFEDGVGLLGDALVQLLAVFVVLVNVAGFSVGLLDVSRYEKLNGFTAALHTPGSIDAWADFEYYIADGYFLTSEAASANYGTQTEVRVAI